MPSNPKNDSGYIKRALIKLERQYGKDEYVLTLKSEISQKSVEIGQLKSYIDELEDTNKQLRLLKDSISTEDKLEIKKDSRIKELTHENHILKKILGSCRKDRENLIIKLNKNGSK